jgi:hypothetical protein
VSRGPQALLKDCQATPQHPGRFETLELVACKYWWPQMSRYIGQYIKTCDLCCRTKLQHCRPTGELHPSETPNKPWDTISVNFIVELPHSDGYDTIMNVVDSVTKRTHFIATHTTVTAVGAARLFLREVWRHHSTPHIVVSDRGPQFHTRTLLPHQHKVSDLNRLPPTDGRPNRARQPGARTIPLTLCEPETG